MSSVATAVPELTPLLFSGDFLYWGIVFLLIALVAGALGSRDVAGFSMEIARIFILIFVVLAIIAFVL